MTRGRGKLEVVSRNELEGVAKLDSSSLSLGRCYQTEWKVLSSGGRCCESEAEGVAKRKSECDSSATRVTAVVAKLWNVLRNEVEGAAKKKSGCDSTAKRVTVLVTKFVERVAERG